MDPEDYDDDDDDEGRCDETKTMTTTTMTTAPAPRQGRQPRFAQQKNGPQKNAAEAEVAAATDLGRGR